MSIALGQAYRKPSLIEKRTYLIIIRIIVKSKSALLSSE